MFCSIGATGHRRNDDGDDEGDDKLKAEVAGWMLQEESEMQNSSQSSTQRQQPKSATNQL